MFPQQFQAPLFSALLFLVIASPATFKLVNDLLTVPLFKTKAISNGSPTKFGLVIHSVVFFALSYVFLKSK